MGELELASKRYGRRKRDEKEQAGKMEENAQTRICAHTLTHLAPTTCKLPS